MKGGERRGAYGRVPRTVRSRDRGHGASPMERPLPYECVEVEAGRRAGTKPQEGKTHFQSNLSSWVNWYVIVGLCHTVSYDVNIVLLQYAPNLLNILHIHAGNTNTALDLTVAMLNNFEFKRDTVQTENDLPAQ